MQKIRLRFLWGLAAGAFALLITAQQAHAVPSYASQTGQPCSSCHVGSFGPQLTPFGRAFKMSGYTLNGGQGLAAHVPLSAMFESSFTHTAQSQPGPAATHFQDNNNPAVDQVSLFVAGRVNDYVGGFMQFTYSGVDQAYLWDNTDLRLSVPIDLPNDANLRLGMSLNNGPTVQDPYNTLYAWGYPFISSSLSPTPTAGPIAGALIGNTLGATFTAWYDNSLYVDVGMYGTMSTPLAKMLGQCCSPGTNTTPMPYARVAYEWDWAGQAAEIGGMIFHAALHPGGTPGYGTDDYTDLALDGTYQYIGDGTNTVSIGAAFTHEIQSLNSSYAQGNAANVNGYLNFFNINATYYYQKTYGISFSVEKTSGSSDAIIYAPSPVGGSNNGSPNSLAFITELDWVPFGKNDSWKAPFANLKLGLQYTAYTQFNGGNSNYDGNGRSAGANNTLYAFAWLAF